MAKKLNDGAYAFLGMAQPVEDKTFVPNGKKVYFAVLASVRNGDCELCLVLGRGDDLNECVKQLKGHRDPGKKRSFSGADLTFELPTDEPFCLNGPNPGILRELDLRDIDKAQVYLGLI